MWSSQTAKTDDQIMKSTGLSKMGGSVILEGQARGNSQLSAENSHLLKSDTGPWEELLQAEDERQDREEVLEDGPPQDGVEFKSLSCPSLQEFREERAGGILVPLVKTPEGTAEHVLLLAGVSGSDVFLDLGCGDGRMVTAAVAGAGETSAARLAAGFDINDTLLRLCRRRANDRFLRSPAAAHVTTAGEDDGDGGSSTCACSTSAQTSAIEDGQRRRRRVRFLKRNFIGMKDDPVFLAATVIFMYLLPPVLAKLEPLLFEALEARPSLRLVTFIHHFEGRTPRKSGLFGVLRLYGYSPPSEEENEEGEEERQKDEEEEECQEEGPIAMGGGGGRGGGTAAEKRSEKSGDT